MAARGRRISRSIYPEQLATQRRDPVGLGQILRKAIRAHGDSIPSLHKALSTTAHPLGLRTLRWWVDGKSGPRYQKHLGALTRIEKRYRLPKGQLSAVLFCEDSLLTKALKDTTDYNKRLIRWHVPADFESRSKEEQREILLWIQDNVLGGGTDFGKYIRWTKLYSYWMRFPDLSNQGSTRAPAGRLGDRNTNPGTKEHYAVDAPPRLLNEMQSFMEFKTAPLSPKGYRRWRRWSRTTAEIKLRFLRVLFGALAAPSDSPVKGFGLPLSKFTFLLLALPATWDWFLAWKQDRRGFLTRWEREGLIELMALVRRDTGWIRQHPELAKGLKQVPGLVSQSDIRKARDNWHAFCDDGYSYARDKAREVRHLTSVHRDPFEPILPVLKSAAPLAEYRKIADETLRLMPNKRIFPVNAAELVRTYLMFRLGMHLGARQRNLRELLCCPKGSNPRTERQLQRDRTGELRWSEAERGWEVFIPAASFKNSTSSFFDGGPFQLMLPDLAKLYILIDEYLLEHRPLLLGDGPDPGTFFIRRYREGMETCAYGEKDFYEAWKFAIQVYGIKNPYTGRGAIAGLLPHGPNSVRDVLATHVLKRTGSYALAAYAIHDTPLTVMKHYGRFLPQEKLAKAAEILNEVWEPARWHRNREHLTAGEGVSQMARPGTMLRARSRPH